MVMAVFVAAAAFLTSEAFAQWSDGGPERFPLTYPPETVTVERGTGVIDVSGEAVRTSEALTRWSDGGPERFPLTYPPQATVKSEITVTDAPVTMDRTSVAFADWSDGGPEQYPLTYPPKMATMKTGFRVTELLDKTVRNAERHDLGSINDVLVSESGRIKYVLLDQGGILGRGLFGMGIGGDSVYAVPWSTIEIDFMDRKPMLDVSLDKLKMAPNFKKSEWAKLNDSEFEGRVHGYYGVKEKMESPLTMFGNANGTYLVSSFMDAHVYDAEGLDLGKVHDFVTDENGRIEYVVVYHGAGLFGIGSRLTPVPWEFAKADPHSRTITVNVDGSRFLAAPTISGNTWSRFDDVQWRKDIYEHFK
jgi:sporulation protein YlmC with PRC-barrel domain